MQNHCWMIPIVWKSSHHITLIISNKDPHTKEDIWFILEIKEAGKMIIYGKVLKTNEWYYLKLFMDKFTGDT